MRREEVEHGVQEVFVELSADLKVQQSNLTLTLTLTITLALTLTLTLTLTLPLVQYLSVGRDEHCRSIPCLDAS